MVIKEFGEVVDVANGVGKAISELFRIHAGIDDGHIPMWEGFGCAHSNVPSSAYANTNKGREPGTRWHLSVSPTLLRSYPTGQVRRKEKGCHYISPYPVLTCRGTAAWHPLGVPLHFTIPCFNLPGHGR